MQWREETWSEGKGGKKKEKEKEDRGEEKRIVKNSGGE